MPKVLSPVVKDSCETFRLCLQPMKSDAIVDILPLSSLGKILFPPYGPYEAHLSRPAYISARRRPSEISLQKCHSRLTALRPVMGQGSWVMGHGSPPTCQTTRWLCPCSVQHQTHPSQPSSSSPAAQTAQHTGNARRSVTGRKIPAFKQTKNATLPKTNNFSLKEPNRQYSIILAGLA